MAFNIGIELRGGELALNLLGLKFRHVHAVGGKAAHGLVEGGGNVPYTEDKAGDDRLGSQRRVLCRRRKHHKTRSVGRTGGAATLVVIRSVSQLGLARAMRTNSQAQGSTGSEPTKQETLESCLTSACLHVSNQKAWPAAMSTDRLPLIIRDSSPTGTIHGQQPFKWQSPMRRITAVYRNERGCTPPPPTSQPPCRLCPPSSQTTSPRKRLEESLFPYPCRPLCAFLMHALLLRHFS